VTKVDAATVRSTIEQSFPQPADLVIVLLGDAAKMRDAVKKYGPVTEMKITDPRFSPATK
jgi:zinc protease